MKSGFQWVTQDMIESSKRKEWKPLLYTICFLSTIAQERRKFGPLGFNIPYEFNYADLTSSLSFLQNHFSEIGDDSKKGPEISWKTLRYMICEVHYGGKITDDFDRLLFKTFGEKWISSEVTKTDFKFFDGYTIPREEDRLKYLDQIQKLSAVDPPEVFGLDSNADIVYRPQQSSEVLNTILDVQPKDSSATGGESVEQKVIKIADDLLNRLPGN
jgi:dynein heavy chain, axonemal